MTNVAVIGIIPRTPWHQKLKRPMQGMITTSARLVSSPLMQCVIHTLQQTSLGLLLQNKEYALHVVS